MTKIATAPIGRFDEALLKKLSLEHSAEQQLWLSGFLYGLATARQPEAPVPAPQQEQVPKVQILYGSQTGNSKKVAQKAAGLIRDQGWEATVTDLSEYAVKNLKSARIALFVVSTQGEGTPPTAAESFYEWLHSARAPKLPELQFAVCSLGDSSYLNFCQTGKDFDERLEALGATRLSARADCDVAYEEPAEQWATAVVNRLKTVIGMQPAAAALKEQLPGKPAFVAGFNRKNPYAAPVLEKVLLNGRGSLKETYHLELGLEGSGLVYEPGDSLGILARNSDRLVEQVLAAAKFLGSEQVEFEGNTTNLASVLKSGKELTVLNRQVLEQYAAHTGHTDLQAITADHERLKKYLWGRNTGDLLREFPGALTPQQLADTLRNISPRLYSIASSLVAHPDEVHLTVSALRYEFGRTRREGLASTFLADRIEVGDSLEVFVEHNEYFKLPADHSTDIIMIGPGTGVAPFRAFVEERKELSDSSSSKAGRNWLFFGNPNFTTDFLYQREWLQYLKTGALDRLDVAFSRDQQEKIYVQHRLLERGRQLFERLENGAYCYVCGDKNRMAADVQQAFLQIIAQESGKGAVYASEYLSNLKKQRRYLEDVY